MTREEQIFNIAAQFAIDETDGQNTGKAASMRGLIFSAFKAGAQWADQHPQWIPVEERLPEETEVVLGVREGGTDVEMYKFMGFNESTNTFDWEWHPYYRAVVDDVTHWMPIVPPRKEENK